MEVHEREENMEERRGVMRDEGEEKFRGGEGKRR